jgi:hypothetical protein
MFAEGQLRAEAKMRDPDYWKRVAAASGWNAQEAFLRLFQGAVQFWF